MPNHSEVVAYETGIRLTQALTLVSDAGKIPNDEILSALVRLESTSIRFKPSIESVLGLERFNQLVSLCLNRWIKAEDQIASETLATDTENLIRSVRSLFISAFDQMSLTQALWLRLGMEIADGSDDTWREGIPTIQPRTYKEDVPVEDRLPYTTLVTGPETPRQWDWANEELVREHCEQLNIELTKLFPDNVTSFTSELTIFQKLPFRTFWGWFAIEDGLHNLAELCLTPRWEGVTQTLSLGDSVLHRYSNRAEMQARLLSAFEDQGWPTSIDCPFNDPKQANQVVTDLNRTLKSTPIRFRGGVTGIHWELRQESEE